MNDLKFTGFLMLIAFVAGILGFINSSSTDANALPPSSQIQIKELSIKTISQSCRANYAGRLDNESKKLFPDPGFHLKEIESQILSHTCTRLIKTEENFRMQQVSGNRLYRPLHNRAFYCVYQT